MLWDGVFTGTYIEGGISHGCAHWPGVHSSLFLPNILPRYRLVYFVKVNVLIVAANTPYDTVFEKGTVRRHWFSDRREHVGE